MSLDAMKQALAALEGWANHGEWVWPESALEQAKRNTTESITALRAAIEQAHGDWDEVEALRASLREHMAEIQRLRNAIEQEPVAWMYTCEGDTGLPVLVHTQKDWAKASWWKEIPLYTAPRQWQGLTDEEVKAPIQRAMQYFGFDSTQYSLGGAATIGFLNLVREIEAKLREKNT